VHVDVRCWMARLRLLQRERKRGLLELLLLLVEPAHEGHLLGACPRPRRRGGAAAARRLDAAEEGNGACPPAERLA